MGRRAGFYWDKREQAYRTETGGRTKYFRGIAREDHAGIAAAFAAYLADVEAASRPPEITVEDLCVAFVGAERGLRPRTQRSNKQKLLVFAEWDPGDGGGILGARTAKSMTSKHLKDFLRRHEAMGRAATYMAGIARAVKAAFAWAASEDGGHLIPSHPFQGVKVPKTPRAPERYAGRREVAAFLRFAWREAETALGVYRRFGRNLTLLMRVAAHTGVRPGELCAAWWTDLDPKRGVLVLPPERHKTGSKTARPRTIFLTPTLVRAIERERRKPHSHPVAVFTHKRGRGAVARGADKRAGEPWGTIVTLPNGKPGFVSDTEDLCRAVRKLRARAIAEGKRRADAGEPTRGLELIQDEGDNRFVLYRLRHTAASDHLMSGGSTSTVAELLGTSPRMLETTYGHLLEDHLAKAAAELALKRRGRGGA